MLHCHHCTGLTPTHWRLLRVASRVKRLVENHQNDCASRSRRATVSIGNTPSLSSSSFGSLIGTVRINTHSPSRSPSQTIIRHLLLLQSFVVSVCCYHRNIVPIVSRFQAEQSLFQRRVLPWRPCQPYQKLLLVCLFACHSATVYLLSVAAAVFPFDSSSSFIARLDTNVGSEVTFLSK